jgi:hypothetical protein
MEFLVPVIALWRRYFQVLTHPFSAHCNNIPNQEMMIRSLYEEGVVYSVMVVADRIVY